MATPTSAAKRDERHDRRGSPPTTQSTKSRLCAGCKYEVFPEKQPLTQQEFEQIPFFSGAVDGYTNRYYCADCLHKSESSGATVSSSGGKNKEKTPSIPREHVFYPTISAPGYLASIIKQIGKPTYYAAENIESDVPYLIPAKSNRLRRLERRSLSQCTTGTAHFLACPQHFLPCKKLTSVLWEFVVHHQWCRRLKSALIPPRKLVMQKRQLWCRCSTNSCGCVCPCW